MSSPTDLSTPAAGAGRRQTLTACLIVQDEQEHLPDCLDTIAFCDEIVLVDGGSRDATVELAERAGATVVRRPWRGYAAQRNAAIAAASGDWVLEIDADERISPELRADVAAFLAAAPVVDIAALPMREVLLGRTLRASTKYPKYRHRLFRRGCYEHDESRAVHEGLVPNGPVAALEGDMVHMLAGSWREALGDAWRYTRLEAAQAQPASSARDYVMQIVVRPAAKAAYRLTIDGGWRDGWGGVAKIALDCASDAVVWMRVLLQRRPRLAPDSETRHFGRPDVRRGPVRIVGLAAGGRAAEVAACWLQAAAGAGADAALISDALTVGGRALAVRRVTRFSPLRVVRALDAEAQLRDVDALLVCGRSASRIARWLPASLRGRASQLDCALDPREGVRRVHEAARC